jgi:putative DNA primase/helicase
MEFEPWGGEEDYDPDLREEEPPADIWDAAHGDPDESASGGGIPREIVLKLNNETIWKKTEKGAKFQPQAAADDVLTQVAVAIAEDGMLWAHHESIGVWSPQPNLIRNALAQTMRNAYKPYWVQTVEDLVRVKAQQMFIAPHPSVINFRNGRIRSYSPPENNMPTWRAWSVRAEPWRWQDYSTVQLPHDYVPGAQCPQFDAFLAGALGADPERIKLAWQIVAASIYSGIPVQRAVMLQGPPACGKSQLLDVIVGLVGERNTTHIPLQKLGERFNVAQVHGKALNVNADLDQVGTGETGTFKMMVAGDPVTGEHKGRSAFNFTPFAMHLFSANQVPPSDDRSGAYTRRWAVLRFDARKPGGPDTRDLGKSIVAAEAEGIICKALGYLAGLLSNGFTLQKHDQEEFQKRTDFLLSFVADEILFDPLAITPARAISAVLKLWKDETGNEHSRVTIRHLEPLFIERGAGRVQNNKVDGHQVKSVRGVGLVRSALGQSMNLWGN